MELKLNKSEIPTARKMIAIHDRNRRHPNLLFVLLISVSVIFFSVSVLMFVKHFEINSESEALTESSSINFENAKDLKRYIDQKFVLAKFSQYSLLMWLWNFAVGAALLTAAILSRRRALVEPVQIKVLRALIKEYDEKKTAYPQKT